MLEKENELKDEINLVMIDENQKYKFTVFLI